MLGAIVDVEHCVEVEVAMTTIGIDNSKRVPGKRAHSQVLKSCAINITIAIRVSHVYTCMCKNDELSFTGRSAVLRSLATSYLRTRRPCLQSRGAIRSLTPTYPRQTMNGLAYRSDGNDVGTHNGNAKAKEERVAERPNGHSLALEPLSLVLIEPHDHGKRIYNQSATSFHVLLRAELTAKPRSE